MAKTEKGHGNGVNDHILACHLPYSDYFSRTLESKLITY